MTKEEALKEVDDMLEDLMEEWSTPLFRIYDDGARIQCSFNDPRYPTLEVVYNER